MQVHRGWENLPPLEDVILTIGTFDGVHYGHQQIIKRINDLALMFGTESVVMTFHPHPRLVLQPNNNDLKLITTIDEKVKLLEGFGIDHFVICPFSREFASIPADLYVKDVLVKHFQPRMIVIGYDHRFGKDRAGNIELLQELGPDFGYEVEEISKQMIEDNAVSSTKVRKALLAGDIASANDLLIHPFSLKGKVVKGEQVGRTLGFPTANLEIDDPHKLIPPNGVYAIRAMINNHPYNGLLSVGRKPTFGDYDQLFIEAYFLDLEADLYGLTLEVVLLGKIRDEMKFDGVDALVKQMKLDESLAKKEYFNS